MKRTFKFTGSPDMKKQPYDRLQFFDPESGANITLKKGESFATEHPRLIEELEAREDMEETGDDKSAGKSKDSPRADASRT